MKFVYTMLDVIFLGFAIAFARHLRDEYRMYRNVCEAASRNMALATDPRPIRSDVITREVYRSWALFNWQSARSDMISMFWTLLLIVVPVSCCIFLSLALVGVVSS